MVCEIEEQMPLEEFQNWIEVFKEEHRQQKQRELEMKSKRRR